MLQKVRNLCRQQQGSAIVFVSVSMLVLLSMLGLIMDGGSVYVEKTHMQKAANAAVLSGAQELLNSNAAVATVVDLIILDHQEQNSQVDTSIDNRKIRVELNKEVPLTFARLIGRDTTPVEAYAAAELLPIGGATGIAPLGIDDSVELQYNVEYRLKVDNTEASNGNFGILALGGPGANTYSDNLRFGYSSEIKLGDVLETQTGNIAGKTREGVQERINNCPNPSGDITIRECSRIILVPVYTPYNYQSGQIKEVKVTGFAYFYITDPMDSKDTAITGKFILRAGAGTVSETALDRGA